MKLGPKVKTGMAIFAVLGLLAAWQGFRYWWYHGYSVGEKTGVVRKLAVKGSPICRYAEGELALSGGVAGQTIETFTFSVDDQSEGSPIMKQLHEAERTATRVTLHYRQDLNSWWRCTPDQYFITQVEK